MIRTDEEALICDFAETYHVYDYKRLPLLTVASLASGLREGSRIRMKMTGQKASTEIMLMAAMVDQLRTMIWMQTKDAQHGRNRPKSVFESLTEDDKSSVAFASGKDFEAHRQQLIKQIAEGGGTDGN